MKARTTEAVVLKSYNQGEYDRLYLMVTREFGKVLALSHGDRRLTKLTAGHLLPFLHARVLLKQSPRGWQLAEAETAAEYGRVAGELLARLHIIAEIVDRFALPEEPDEELWQAVERTAELTAADRLSQLGFVEVLVKVAEAVGLMPRLGECVVSGRGLTEGGRLGWSSLQGGLVDLEAVGEAAAAEYYHLQYVETVKLLRLAGRISITRGLRVPDQVVREAEWLLLDYFQVQLARSLKSLPSLGSW